MKKKEIKQLKNEIKIALLNSDVETLSHIGKEGHGFLMKSLRKSVWVSLCGLSCRHRMECLSRSTSQSSYADQNQVHLDSERSFFQYKLNPFLLRKHRSQLTKLLSVVFKHYPELCYYQGLHDIAQILLLTLPFSHALPLMEHLVFYRLRDFMLPTLDGTVKQLQLILAVIKARDPTLYEYLIKADIQCYFALSWLITWFAHDVSDISVVCRLFDFFISSHPLTVVYTCAQVVLDNRTSIIELLWDNSGADLLHSYLCKLPASINVNQLIKNTCATISAVPFSSLPLDRYQISPYSCLRNTGDPWEYMSRSNGLLLFRLQLAELQEEKHKPGTKVPAVFLQENIFNGCNMLAAITVIGIGIVASQLIPKSTSNS
ncbi:GTPase-activating protein gyp10 [Schizosaccharomyces pombe]|uniref:GTPase-activating protein gyp10 n=1 Tax=Schizosaccharomyces pombe (strain 972 / ATCC 24843) TaxID=284812 RepID=GYP10_SCHPO|nr:GTPase-activating protein Gyp10 [Schizosaccharomyces pombe]O94661.1 RecName: Full=GTPase-activating protein gyp10 [Schizosaccharomyces pombe 972h-]CAB37599.1 GTPase activating protein Gyp10 [Schizosaccharomyces pombe]|eukprot:NP_595501.1 GTPase-activating protein Gyp10 [Schizosaccharomyces pombe]